MNKRFLVLLSALLVALAGCTTEEGAGAPDTSDTTNDAGETPGATPATQADYPELAFTASESSEGGNTTYSFDGPDSAPAGWKKVTLTSQGMEPHQVGFYRLAENKTAEELMAFLHAMHADPANASAEDMPATPMGGVAGVTFGKTASVLLELTPGDYVLLCNIPGPSGMAHAAHGMAKNFTVTEAEGEALPAPTADFTVTLRDYAFELPENVSAGTFVVAFVNEGEEPHEGVVAELAENKTMQDLLAFFRSPEGPPPGALVGGPLDVLPGQTGYAILTFESGKDYGLVCFFPAKSDHAPHFTHGMVAQFSVA